MRSSNPQCSDSETVLRSERDVFLRISATSGERPSVEKFWQSNECALSDTVEFSNENSHGIQACSSVRNLILEFANDHMLRVHDGGNAQLNSSHNSR